MSKLSKAKTDLTFLKNRLNEMKEHPWRVKDKEVKAFERLVKYCDVYVKLLKIKDKIEIKER